MIYSLKEAQKVYLGSQEVSKIFLRGLEIFSSISADPYSDYVTLLTHFNTDFSDSSTNNLQLSAKLFPAIPVINTSLFKYGGGSVDFELNNPGCYIETPFNEGLQFPGDFTVEMWYYPTSLSVDQCLYDASLPDQSPTRDNSFALVIDTSGQMFLFHNGTPNFTTSNPTINTWNHIAISRSGSSLRVFLNGNVVLTLTNSVNFNRGGALISTITEILGSYTINGYLDDLRVTNGIARYTENFTPPTSEFPNPSDPYGDNVSLLLHMDGTTGAQTFVDSSTNSFTVSAFGTANIDNNRKFGTGSGFFNGSSYLRVTDNSVFSFNTGNNSTVPFTIEAWIYPNVSNSTIRSIVSKDTFGVNFSWCLAYNSTNLVFITRDDNERLFFPTTININNWYHVAITHDGTTLRGFLNGNLLSYTETVDGVFDEIVSNSSSDITVGCFSWNSPNGYFIGAIDELRITKGVARYTSNFVPQTAPFADPVTITPLDPWLSVLNSSYSSNIVAAYDFREYSGTTVNAKVGPNLVATGNVTFDSNGAVFTRTPNSYMESNTTISVTYPFTMVYVGKVGAQGFDELVHMAVQPIKWSQTEDTNAIIFSRGSQGILGYNGLDNNAIPYIPNNTEWYYIAISFLNGTYRYQVRKASGNLNGTLTAQTNPAPFNGFIGIGAGLPSATSYNFNGNMRLALLINQGFSTEQEMNDLYNTIASGPAEGIPLT